jgi:hypothetical protein
MEAGIQEGSPISAARRMEGAKRDQKLAAIMTPAANPNMPSSSLLLGRAVVNTMADPAAVTAQVKRVPSNAWRTGEAGIADSPRDPCGVGQGPSRRVKLTAIHHQ